MIIIILPIAFDSFVINTELIKPVLMPSINMSWLKWWIKTS